MLGWAIGWESDFPHHVVVRPWTLHDGEVWRSLVGCLCASLAEARACLPADAVWLPHEDDDDPWTVETWI